MKDHPKDKEGKKERKKDISTKVKKKPLPDPKQRDLLSLFSKGHKPKPQHIEIISSDSDNYEASAAYEYKSPTKDKHTTIHSPPHSHKKCVDDKSEVSGSVSDGHRGNHNHEKGTKHSGPLLGCLKELSSCKVLVNGIGNYLTKKSPVSPKGPKSPTPGSKKAHKVTMPVFSPTEKSKPLPPSLVISPKRVTEKDSSAAADIFSWKIPRKRKSDESLSPEGTTPPPSSSKSSSSEEKKMRRDSAELVTVSVSKHKKQKLSGEKRDRSSVKMRKELQLKEKSGKKGSKLQNPKSLITPSHIEQKSPGHKSERKSSGKKAKEGKGKDKASSTNVKAVRSIVFSSDDSEADVPLSKLKGLAGKSTSSHRQLDHKQKKKRCVEEKENTPRIKVTKKFSKTPLKQKSLLDFAKGSSSKKKDSLSSSQPKIVKKTQSPKKEIKEEKKSAKKPLTEEERKERLRQRLLAKKELKKKVDDHELQNPTPLPMATPVNLPCNIGMDGFSDILMITEFFCTFHKLLMPEDSTVISAEDLCQALGSGKEGFQVVSKVLLVFLRILCAEEDSEIEGLGVSIADMPLTIYTVSELLRYYLEVRVLEKGSDRSTEKQEISKEEHEPSSKSVGTVKTDENDDHSSVSSDEKDESISNDGLPKRIIKQLKFVEFFTMSAVDQLKILVYLFNQVLDSDEFSDHIILLQNQCKEVMREQDILRKKKAKERKEQMAKAEGNKGKEVVKSGAFDKFLPKASHSKEHPEAPEENVADDKETAQESKAKLEDKTGEGKQSLELENERMISTEMLEVEIKGEVDEDLTKVDKEEKKANGKGKGREPQKEEEITSDLVMVVKQRRLLAAQQLAMKEELEKKDKERRAKLEEEYQQQKKIQGWKETLERYKRSMRLDAIGSDRDYKLYWILSGGNPYLYVEDGWMYHEAVHKQISSWTYYSTVEEVNDLLKALCERGIREHNLKTSLLSSYATLTNRMKKRLSEQAEPSKHTEDDTVTAFHADIIESATRSVKGSLGNMPDLEAWQEKVRATANMEDLASFVLELQGSVYPKNFQGFLSANAESSAQAEFWRKLVAKARTMSALHLLLGLLENSISWDRSAENAKCKVCRRKGDELLILCDVCNCAYHGYCLRPALDYLPPEGWQCPACLPTPKRQRRCARPEIKEEEPESEVDEEEVEDNESGEESDAEEEEESGSEGESDHESVCHACGEGGEVICCDACPLVFHLDCHDPPLRRLPRGTWNCCECRNPKRSMRNQPKGRSGNKRTTKGRRARRRQLVSGSSSAEDSVSCSEEEEELEEEAALSKTALRKRKRGAPPRRGVEASSSESEEEESARRGRQQGKRRRTAPPGRSRRSRRNYAPNIDKEEETSDTTQTRSRKRSSRAPATGDEETEHKDGKTRKRRKQSDPGCTGNAPMASPDSEDVTSKQRDSGRGRHRRGNNYEITACENIMAKLWGNDSSWAFKAPVNLKQIPDYLKYVDTPMDLWTIKEKLNRLEYEDAFQFIEDVRLVLKNSRSYNSETSEVGKAGIHLEGYFQELLENYLPGIASTLNGV